MLARGATVLVPNPQRRYLHLTGSEPQRIGLRVSAFPAALAAAIAQAGPILATSANLHGGPDPRTLGDVPAELAAGCAVLVDGGPAIAGRASTVLDLSAARPVILREGRSPRRTRSRSSPDATPERVHVTHTLDDLRNLGLAEIDPEIARLCDAELARQRDQLELIASENFTWPSVLEAVGSVLTNKYAEGLPGKRYYGGCEVVDEVEELAIARAKELFGAEHANVQPHSGASANMAAYYAVLDPGDAVLGLRLDHGGHLTHGLKVNFSGRYYRFHGYSVRREDGRIDLDEVRALALEHRPKLIVAGGSAYPREIDARAFRAIADEAGALLMVDMAHFSGLVAAGLHQNPVESADIVCSTTHKTLAGRARASSSAARSSPRRSTAPSSRASRAARSAT